VCSYARPNTRVEGADRSTTVQQPHSIQQDSHRRTWGPTTTPSSRSIRRTACWPRPWRRRM
jgi:hypothetical protein